MLLVARFALIWRGRHAEVQERGTEYGRASGEDGRDEKCNLITTVEGGEMAGTRTQRAVRASGGEAGKDGETRRATHHERGVDDTRRKTGILRRNVIQGGQQHRVEGHACANSRQSHARKYVCDEVPSNWHPCEEGQPNRGQQQSYHTDDQVHRIQTLAGAHTHPFYMV